VIVALLAIPGPAHKAATRDPVPPQLSIPIEPGMYETVVTASRKEVERFEASRSIETVREEEIEEVQARTVTEVLEEVPGVHMQRTNGGAGSAYLRGLTGPENLLLVDGIRFNNTTFRTGPTQYVNVVQPFLLERVEVLRGPSSVRYGDGAMGGVIHLVTKYPRPDGGAPGYHGWGSAWARSADLGRGVNLGFDLTVGDVGFVVAGGYSDFRDLRSGRGEMQPLSAYGSAGALARLRYVPDDHWTVDAGYLFSAVLDAGRADGIGHGDTRFYDNWDHLAHVRAARLDPGWFRRFEVAAAYHRTREHVDRNTCDTMGSGLARDLDLCISQAPSTLVRRRVYDDVVDTVGGSLDATFAFFDDRWVLDAGFDGYQDFVGSSLTDARVEDGFTVTPGVRGSFSDGSRYTSLGAFLHTDVTVWDFGPEKGRLMVGGGARVSHFRAHAPGVPELGDVRYDFTGVAGGASLQFVKPDQYNVWFSYDQGFRAPNLQETTVLGNTGDRFEVPNPDLGPVRSNTFEVGTRLDLGPLRLDVAGFFSMLDNFINTVPTTYQGKETFNGVPVTTQVNSASARIFGVEAGARVGIRHFTLRGDVTWTRGTVENDDGAETPVRRIPPVFGSLGIRYDHHDDAFWVEIFMDGASRQERLHPSDRGDLRICGDRSRPGVLVENCHGTPGWITVNLRGGWRFGDGWSLQAAVMNLTDENYRVHASGLDAPGFNARVTLQVEM